MGRPQRGIAAGIFVIGGITLIAAPSARAQIGMSGAGRSLGGYGTYAIGQYYSRRMGGYLPYNGNASGFVSYRAGDGGAMGFQSIRRMTPRTSVGGTTMPTTPIGGTSLAGGMGTASQGGMEAGLSRRTFALFGYGGGIGMGSTMIGTAMTKQAGMRRAPLGPGFGYPFQMPTTETQGGMSIMAMP
jgi:hypothetical protein